MAVEYAPPGAADKIYCGMKVPPPLTLTVPLTCNAANVFALPILSVNPVAVALVARRFPYPDSFIGFELNSVPVPLYPILLSVAVPPKPVPIVCVFVPAVLVNK